MLLHRATVLAFASFLMLVSCTGDSDKSKADEQNQERFSKPQTQDAQFVVDIIDTSYGILNVAQMGEQHVGDSAQKEKLQNFIQTQTSAMLKFKTFAESKGITIPFSGPEKTKKSVKKLEDKTTGDFNEAWIEELKKLQHKLETDIEGYRSDVNDPSLVNVLDSTLMLVKQNKEIITDLDQPQDEKPI